jgi:hypothetical protein
MKAEKPKGQHRPKPKGTDAPLGVMTRRHKRWAEFCERLEGPEGCNFRKKPDGRTTWDCKSGRDKSRAIAILTAMGATVGEIVASCEYFSSLGGYCDCEILFNVRQD